MGVDYYAILQINRSATVKDVKKAYRKWALINHPDKVQSPQANLKFKLLAEAYDILSDSHKRAIYDQFGEEGLRGGIPTEDGEGFAHGYTFHGDAMKVFDEFFGGDNPYADFFDENGKFAQGFGGFNGQGRKKQDPPIERDLFLTLEEIYHGCVKKMKISRRVMNDDGHTSSIRDKILTITVRPGWKAGTRVTFPKEGDQGPNNVPSDIVFVIKDKPHPLFRRVNEDLYFTAKVPLGKALIGCSIEVPTLDGRLLNIPINDVVHPEYTKKVANEGMPLQRELGDIGEDEGKKGDMIIEFFIEFPKNLAPEKKQLVTQALLI